jgi:phosphoenolpyruvate carboxylase
MLQTTHDVACLSRWIAADLYLKEVDALRFELSMNHASDEVGEGGAAGP